MAARLEASRFLLDQEIALRFVRKKRNWVLLRQTVPVLTLQNVNVAGMVPFVTAPER